MKRCDTDTKTEDVSNEPIVVPSLRAQPTYPSFPIQGWSHYYSVQALNEQWKSAKSFYGVRAVSHCTSPNGQDITVPGLLRDRATGTRDVPPMFYEELTTLETNQSNIELVLAIRTRAELQNDNNGVETL
jgi:hypothetical protein